MCEKPGERCVAGDTGLPTIRTAEIAIQSGSDEGVISREPMFGIRNRNNNHNQNMHTRTTGSSNNPIVPSHIHTSQHAHKTVGVPLMVPQQQQQQIANKLVMQAIQEQQNTGIVTEDPPSTVSEKQRTQSDASLPIEPCQSQKDLATDAPVSVKIEVHDVDDDEDKMEPDMGYLDQSDMVCDDDDMKMAPLSNEEDFYDDHFGTSVEFDDAGSQSGSQGGVISHQRYCC